MRVYPDMETILLQTIVIWTFAKEVRVEGAESWAVSQ